MHRRCEGFASPYPLSQGRGCFSFLIYLSRNFEDQVLAEHMWEEEIWITSFFNLTVNVIKRVEQ